MFLLVFAALGGGLTTAVLMRDYGALGALLAAPLGGSACAVLAGLGLAMRRGPEAPTLPALDEQTDAMVAALREVSARSGASGTAPGERRGAA
ncbi:conserved hypothetical protein [Methylobacterium sp. 4-46]|uniref:hypothetical protein n=1 Tax=unclassified Methylobacterium TaxID=2615210 RepID=UPI000152D369|nr:MULTISPECIES: hypothetical protein [Methylobacterium]ACA15103.1 conserved hypothetical protein [Methylobacterium sp. 4-46]WFT80837.1 hypothetical protein QA634_02745 [Methylobacterium nodulans]